MPYYLTFRPIRDDDGELGLARVALRGEGVLKCFYESLLRVWFGPRSTHDTAALRTFWCLWTVLLPPALAREYPPPTL